ncbi:MAG TPA: proline iminopeptidase-family hydrolase [Gaiellaceae bacterium]
MDAATVTEGRIPFHGHETWYRVVGDGETPDRLPLLCLHGGPGAGWQHLESYEALAEGRRAVFYDQLGCGNSAVPDPHDPAMWTTELYVEEVAAVREALGLDRVVVLGQSWGGMLALAYALTQPDGLAGLVVQSSPASVPFWMTEVARLRAELPTDVQEVLDRHEAAGTTHDPEYEEAAMVFYRRHVCRADPWPDWLQRCFATLTANPEVYETMNGPTEFHVIGTIKDFDISARLGEIHVPTLLISGRHDEVTPATVEQAHRALPDSEWVLLEESSHMAQAEQPEETLAAIRRFLDDVRA